MTSEIIINELNTCEVDVYANLINEVFDEFVGKDYADKGKETFKDFINPKNALERYNSKNSVCYVARYKSEIIGILEIRSNNHISLFFVKSEFHGKGIGKKLWKHFLDKIKKENIEVDKVTVNSSIFAENIYARLGFVKTHELQESDGIKFIKMECKV